LSFIFGFVLSPFGPLSFTAPCATSIVTVPLQSEYSLFLFIDVLVCSKSDNTNWYCCPTTCVVSPFTVAIKSWTFVNVFVKVVASSPSTYTVISLSSSASVVSKYLSITLNVIVSVFAVVSFVDNTFLTTGFIKSTKSPLIGCKSFWFGFTSSPFGPLSFTAPAITSIETLPLHSV